MKEIFFNTIQEFNDYIGMKTLHPLVSIARVENTSPIQEAVHHYGLYALFEGKQGLQIVIRQNRI